VSAGPVEDAAVCLDLPDLIRMRRAVGRPKDWRRAEELERLGRRVPPRGLTLGP